MKFDTPAGTNPIDRLKVIGKPTDRIDGPLKTTGTAKYAYEWHEEVPNAAYGHIVGSAIAKGRIASIDLTAAKAAPGVLAIVTASDAGKLGKGQFNTVKLLGGPDIDHYQQALAVVVAETFEQARAAAALVRIEYTRSKGRFDLADGLKTAPLNGGMGDDGKPAPKEDRYGDFETAFAAAPVKIDKRYTTPDQSHAMIEPHASIAAWNGDKLTVWNSNQMVDWSRADIATTLGIPKDNVRLISPYVGGGFGSKLWIRADVIMAALGAKAARRPVKIALPRPFLMNNTPHRPATEQRIRIGTDRAGKILAFAHESGTGDVQGGQPETVTAQSKLLYAGANRLLQRRLAVLDLPESNAMRAPGEAQGLMALEIAMDEMAEQLQLDPVEFRIINDTPVDPMDPTKRFSQRQLIECFRLGADRFGWSKRNATPAQVRDGHWLVGMGVATAFRGHINAASKARVRLDARGFVTVESDMTDIGTGSYTIFAQTVAETMGIPLDKVVVKLGDSAFPVSAGSGGQWGANSATAGVYAACMKLRSVIADRLKVPETALMFEDGSVRYAAHGDPLLRQYFTLPLASMAKDADIVVEDGIEFGDLAKRMHQATFGAHFVEVGVDSYTGVTRVRRMLAVCAAGRILNPKAARSQVIGAMTMGVGGALMEELAIDKRFGFFVNHDLAGYEVPVHADIPHQEVVFLDEVDPTTSPMKAKGVGELGLCGVGAAIANAVYNATGVRIRDYPITLDKYLDRLPQVA